MGRRVLAILLATVLALVGAVLVYLYAHSADQRAVAAQQPTPVYVTKALIPRGTSLKNAVGSGLLAQTNVAAAAVPVGALQTVDATNGSLVALTDLAPGQYVLAAGFGASALSSKVLTVPEGMLAMSMSLSDPARVGNFVTPGSHITVFATAKLDKEGRPVAGATTDSAGAGTDSTVVLLPDVLVIGMGDTTVNPAPTPTSTTNQQAQSAGAVFLVTVAVTPQDSARVVQSINTGMQLYAGLRGANVTIPPKLQVNGSDPVGK